MFLPPKNSPVMQVIPSNQKKKFTNIVYVLIEILTKFQLSNHNINLQKESV